VARHRDRQLTATVRVLFFARYAEIVGRPSATIDVPVPATVADVVNHVRRDLPGGAELPARPLAALNATHTRLDAPVADGDEVALLPPIAGG
jgi:molybdopterin converting factor subunit 1